MDTSAIIAVVAVIVVLVVAVLVVRPLMRRRRLQERFGPEYHRTVESHENRAVAERELIEREKRYKQLELRPLSPEAHERYSEQWTQVQAQFVDAPQRTVADADRLVTALMAERGYPTEGYEQQLADLSVEHASTLEHYRAAHDIHQRAGDGHASTEDLRNAMVHYRALFQDLLRTGSTHTPDHPGRRVADADVDRDEMHRDRLDRDGVDRDRLDRDRLDRDGVDRDGVDRDRLDRDGTGRHGVDRDDAEVRRSDADTRHLDADARTTDVRHTDVRHTEADGPHGDVRHAGADAIDPEADRDRSRHAPH